MADVDVDDPGDSDVVSSFPANERASRAAILALLSGDAFGGGDMGGSANAHTLTVSNTGVTLVDGGLFWGVATATNDDACTLQINSLTAKSLWLPNGTAISSSHAGAITSGSMYVFCYHAADDAFYVLNASGYRDQVSYDQEYPVGSTLLRRTTTTPTVPFGVTATWTRTTTESFILIEGTTPTTGGGATVTVSSETAGAGTLSATGSASATDFAEIDISNSELEVPTIHANWDVTGSTAAHTHDFDHTDIRFRSYAVWERTA